MDVRFLLAFATVFALTSNCSALLTACANNTECTADQANSECDLVTDTDGNGDGECVCTAAYKDNGAGGCTAKGLGDTCGANSDCSGVLVTLNVVQIVCAAQVIPERFYV
ncbi:uncharacterized protein LOC132721148 [Ruditapes philippinarum]|uniref:uncharacterized protein LOC132721148 n=1 Tax=Ruditapes philippinarum TaxID=129788 RepID=UPI00295ACF52|nr:uncharacterized protein LOC132721148 [Ruditapes philippinarum]